MNRYIAFSSIAETGSFSKTAAEMGYSQSAVSQMIRSLEQETLLPLLVRSHGGVRLTREGEALLPKVRALLNSYHNLEEAGWELRGTERGEIRIGTIASVSQAWLPLLIRDFQQRYPDVSFNLAQGEYTSIARWIKEGSVDVGFVNGDAVTGLSRVSLDRDEMMAVLPPEHPLASKDCVTLQDLAAEPFICLEEGHFNEAMNAFRHLKLKPNIKLRVYDDYTVLAMVEKGLGCSIIPEMNLSRHDYAVVSRPLAPKLTRNLCLVFERLQQLPKMTRRFVEFVEERFEAPTSAATEKGKKR